MVKGSLKDEEFSVLKSELKSMIQKYAQLMDTEQQKLNDGMFTLQSYHKRLNMLQNRIKTYAQICKSEQENYREKFKQAQKDLKNIRAKDELNDELKIKIKDLMKSLEEKEISMSTLKHELKLEKGQFY